MAPNRGSTDFGSRLRAARERRGVSLREIANATKISAGVLEALERNDFSRLPGGIFSRAFIRSYAVEVGLDPDETIEEFLAQLPAESPAAVVHHAAEPIEDRDAIESDRRLAATVLRLIAISVPIAGAVLYFSTRGARVHPAPPSESTTTAAPPSSPAAPPENPSAQTTTDASPAPPQTTTDASPAPAAPASEAPAASPSATPPSTASAVVVPATTVGGERLMVGIVAARACWVSATVDGQKSIERLLQPGEQHIVEVHRELVLTAGDASALTLTVNGTEAKPLGKPGEVVTARLNLTNFKDYLPQP